jgi:hypothetical protein
VLDEASVQRRVFVVRMAAWGTVLLLAVIAFNLRAGASADTDQGANGPQVNGRTSQGQAIWSIADREQVREIQMSWQFKCEGGGRLEPFGGTFRDSTDHFDYDGAKFKVAIEDEMPQGKDGWTAHLKAEVGGEVHADGQAVGTSAAVMWFTRTGQRGAVCRSGPVRWSTP